MPEELLLRHCSPTLAGLKTGSLFTCAYAGEEEMRAEVRAWNRRMVPKGLRVVPLRYRNGRGLIYLYRPGRLNRDLTDPVAAQLLAERGYPMEDGDRCVCRLMSRLREGEEFPHEIGLFLGYPPVDVHGFIHVGPKGCKCVGDWKVYGDEELAKRKFAQYRKCTAVYCDCHARGRTVEQLTVPATTA